MKLFINRLLFLNLCLMFSGCFFVLDDGRSWNEKGENELVPGYNTKDLFLHEIQLEINFALIRVFMLAKFLNLDLNVTLEIYIVTMKVN